MSSKRMFTFGERVGQLFTVIGASMSLASVAFILAFAIYRWSRRRWGPKRATQFEALDNSLFLNLMFADMIQAIGEIPTVKWMVDGYITEGRLCNAQSGLRHFGVLGVAFSSLFIGIYTFWVLVLRRIPPKYASKIGVVIIWVMACMIAGISSIVHGQRDEKFYGASGYWCWIRYQWRTEQLMTSYFWLWFSAFSMLAIYGVIFLAIRGYIKTPRSGYLASMGMKSSSRSDTSSAEEPMFRRTQAIATRMLYFPLVYIITIGPNSIARWIEFSGTKVPYEATLFANTMFRLSGFFNFVLYVTTRPRMALGDKVIINKTVVQQSNGTPSRLGTYNLTTSEDRRSPSCYENDKVTIMELGPIKDTHV